MLETSEHYEQDLFLYLKPRKQRSFSVSLNLQAEAENMPSHDMGTALHGTNSSECQVSESILLGIPVPPEFQPWGSLSMALSMALLYIVALGAHLLILITISFFDYFKDQQ